MAIDYHDLTSITDTLKLVYGQGIQNQFDQDPITYNQFPKSDKSPKGLGYEFSIRYERAQGVGGRVEGGKLPDPLVGKFDKGRISPKYIYGSIRLTGPMIEAAKGDMAAFVNGLADSVDDIYKSVIMDMNRQAWCDGFGLMATITTAGTTNTGASYDLVCDNDKGMMYVKEGMLVDVYEANGVAVNATAYASAQRVQSVDMVSKTATMEAAGTSYDANHPISTHAGYTTANGQALEVGSHLVKMGARDVAHATSDTSAEITGMDGIFDDGTLLSTFENIVVATFPKWQANMLTNSSVNRELSIDLLLQAVDLTRYHAGANKIQMRMGLGQRRKYANLLLPDVRFQPGQLKGGYEVLTFAAGDGSVEIIIDPMTQVNKIYMHPAGAVMKYEMAPLGWGSYDQRMHQRAGYDEWDMFLRLYTNLGTEQRNACTLIGDLTEPNIWS